MDKLEWDKGWEGGGEGRGDGGGRGGGEGRKGGGDREGEDKERDAVAAPFRVLTLTEIASARKASKAVVERDDAAAPFHVLTCTEIALAWKASETLAKGRFWQAGVAIGLAKCYPYHWKNIRKTW